MTTEIVIDWLWFSKNYLRVTWSVIQQIIRFKFHHYQSK